MTHTFVVITLSSCAYDEIKQKMEQAGYGHVINDDNVIDMHGMAVNKNEALEISQALCAKDQ